MSKLICSNPNKGVYLYWDENNRCVDIDCDDDVTELHFCCDESGPAYIRLYDVLKQFPHIKTLYIHSDIVHIHISNFMFPNVENVVSYSGFYRSDTPYLIYTGVHNSILVNTFCNCRQVDMSGIFRIENYALEGCPATDFINYDNVDIISELSFKGSLFLIKGMQKNDYVSFNDILVEVNHNVDILYFTDEGIKRIPAYHDFNGFVSYYSGFNALRATPSESFSENVIISSKVIDDDKIGYYELLNTLIDAFNSPRIKSIKIDGESERFCIKNDLLISNKTVMSCLNSKSGIVEVPDGIECIAKMAFYYRSDITNVILPDSLKEIGSMAFIHCSNLVSVNIPKSVKQIYSGAFKDCINLKSITLLSEDTRLFVDSFVNVCEVVLDASLNHVPKSLFYAFNSSNNSALVNICDKFGIKIRYKDLSVLIPRGIELGKVPYKIYLEPIEKAFEELGTTAYEFTDLALSKYIAAFESYCVSYDYGIKRYLKSVSKRFVSELFSFAEVNESMIDEQYLIRIIKSDILSKNTLEYVLKKIEGKNMPIVTAYILDTIGKENGSSQFNL